MTFAESARPTRSKLTQPVTNISIAPPSAEIAIGITPITGEADRAGHDRERQSRLGRARQFAHAFEDQQAVVGSELLKVRLRAHDQQHVALAHRRFGARPALDAVRPPRLIDADDRDTLQAGRLQCQAAEPQVGAMVSSAIVVLEQDRIVEDEALGVVVRQLPASGSSGRAINCSFGSMTCDEVPR